MTQARIVYGLTPSPAEPAGRGTLLPPTLQGQSLPVSPFANLQPHWCLPSRTELAYCPPAHAHLSLAVNLSAQRLFAEDLLSMLPCSLDAAVRRVASPPRVVRPASPAPAAKDVYTCACSMLVTPTSSQISRYNPPGRELRPDLHRLERCRHRLCLLVIRIHL